ncbi:MAG: DotI/IcmL family type IV secretion protein [Alphaproteobacteria bacterium]|nr:DotI/IcmL family type IV secretion protein [Alphaproteobacteria bacterium]MCL2505532.1 DotI/IcmL family type IV secretion protein [Alphaproteobacteria bacterium]
MPIKDAVSTVLNRNSFYKDGYRTLLRISFIQTGIIILLIIAVVSLAATIKVKPVYFATTADGRIIDIVPLDQPYLTNARVVSWVAGAVQEIMGFGYHDYERHMDKIKTLFTISGFSSFQKALSDAKFMEAVKVRRVVVGLQIRGAPEITNELVRNGVYVWYIKVPVTLHFDGEQPPAPQSFDLILQLMRVSTLQNPDGIGIEQWLPSPSSNRSGR